MMDILTDASDLLAAMEANYISYFAGFAQLPYLELHIDPEILWVSSNLPYWNTVLRAQLATHRIATRVESTCTHFRSLNMPLLWQTLPSTQPPDLGSYLKTYGLKPVGGRPHMAADLLSLPAELPIPPSLLIERVYDETGFDKWFQASVAGFEMSPNNAAIYADAYTALGFGPGGPFLHYVGYLQGEPVTSSTLLLADGVAGIYDVSTTRAARRQGLGAAITLAPLLEARARGYRYAILQSSQEGYNVYRSLGFEEKYREDNYLLEN
jgi:ribosomal protein S18 acetylase RimI-like enzyme